MSDMDQPPLFDSPAPPPRRFRPPPTSNKIRYTKAKAKTKLLLCDDCRTDIHELGQALAPYPRHAVWRRSDDAGSMLLCQAHKDERQDDESR